MTDPRYDPRFQRGWDGDPAARVVNPPDPPDPAPAKASPAVAESVPADSVPAEPAAPDDDAWIEQPRYNPFRIALAVTGVALLAVGGWLTWVMVQGQQNMSTPDGAVFGQLPYLLMPPVVLAGLVAVIAAIAVGGRSR
ncbi:hypothetical protein GCM10009840_06230 [Pseudolysinimonas kribbensis]|uniref:DUF3098 domain-containing protein n=1 Tax=Pseudolysinimonas kribbensis TaxID=433641 RepID=A0ABQ6K5G4_9MICO|nr:hypothetical protein [Pseudolysinimonas kribbensis]GMA94981.1 hypothetical protein GCM10025881_18050 [Pseudolysinimonas kribbensis]